MGNVRARWAVAALAVAVIVAGTAGCGKTNDDGEQAAATTATTTTTAPTTTTTAPVTTTTSPAQAAAATQAADAQMIVSVFRKVSDSWYGGIDNGIHAEADNAHPQMEVTFEKCRDAFDGYGEIQTYEEETVIDKATFERDDSWVIPAGPTAGQKPAGRVYIFKVTLAKTIDGAPDPEATAEMHGAVLDGRAYFFPNCTGA